MFLCSALSLGSELALSAQMMADLAALLIMTCHMMLCNARTC